VLNLLVKDFKLQFFTGSNTKRKILGLIVKILLSGLLAGVVTFIFTQVIKKVISYDRAINAYLTLFLAVISVIMIILNLFRAYRLFFNDKDVEILVKMPVANSDIILSKLIVILFSHIVTSLIFVFPIFVAYYSIVGGTPKLYFLALFYPLLSFIFEVGIALIFVYPYKLLIDYLKKHILIQFIVALAILLTLSILYARVLNIFMDMVVNNNLNILFTTDYINDVINFTNKLIPLVYLIRFYLREIAKVVPYLLISIPLFVLGLTICIFAFNFFRNVKFQAAKGKVNKKVKLYSVSKILIKKELIILFKDSSNMFSFSALLVIQPLLMWLVIYAINGVFSSGTFQYVSLIIKDIIPLIDIVLVMLFTTITSSGASNYISNERKTMKILKTIPVSPVKQVIIKVLVPFSLSFASLVISSLVLLVGGLIQFNTFIFGFILASLLLVLYMSANLKEEMKIRNDEKKNQALSTSFAYVVPIIFFLVSILISYLGYNINIAYLVTIGLIIMMFIPFVIKAKDKICSDFLDLEVIN